MATLPSGIRAAGNLASSNGSYLNHAQDTTPDTVSAALDNMPSDFTSMDSGLQIDVERSLQASRSNDDYSYGVRIVNGGTILAAGSAGGAYETSGAAAVTSTTDSTDTISFTYVNAVASKATWDGATVEFEQTINKSKGWDGSGIRYDTVELSGNYTAATGTEYTNTLLGGSTPAGALSQAVDQNLAGASTPAGSLGFDVTHSLDAGSTPAGAVAHAVSTQVDAGVTPAGALTTDKIPTTTGVVRLGFQNGTGPTSDMDGCRLYIRARKTGTDTVRLHYAIYDSSGLVQGDGGTGWLPSTSFTTLNLDLSTGGQVTDWNTVEVEVWVHNETAGGTDTVELADLWFAYPGTVGGATEYTQTLTGGVTPAGDPTHLASTSQDATLTSAGILEQHVSTAVGGSVSPAGALSKEVAWSLGGALSPAGDISQTVTTAVAGALATAGARSLAVLSSLVGTLTSAGTVATQAIGSVTTNDVDGSVSPAGALTHVVLHNVDGAVTSSGAAVKEVDQNVDGASTPAGGVAHVVATTTTGTVTTAGSLNTQAVGSVSTQDVDGSLSLAGTLSHVVSQGLDAGSTPLASVTQLSSRTDTGALSPAAIAALQPNLPISGSLTTAGDLGTQLAKMLTGALSTASDIIHKVSQLLVGTSTPTGTAVNVELNTADIVRFTLSGADDGPITNMNGVYLNVRYGVENTGVDTLKVILRLYQGASLLGTVEDQTDTDPKEVQFDLSSGITQVTDWSDLELEVETAIVAGGGGAIYVYDLWMETPQARVITFAVLQSVLNFGATGGWPDWDTVWDGPYQDSVLRKRIEQQQTGVLTSMGAIIQSSVITGMLSLLGTLALKFITRRRPSGNVNPNDRRGTTTAQDYPNQIAVNGHGGVSTGSSGTKVAPAGGSGRVTIGNEPPTVTPD